MGEALQQEESLGENLNRDLFESLYPEPIESISKISRGDLPGSAKTKVSERESEIRYNLKEDVGSEFFRISHQNPEYADVFVSAHFIIAGKRLKLEEVQVFDYADGVEDHVGYSRLLVNEEESMPMRMQTHKDHRFKSLASRRYLIMNAVSQGMGYEPVSSGNFTNDAPAHVWESLVRKKYAKLTHNDEEVRSKRFIFEDLENWPEDEE